MRLHPLSITTTLIFILELSNSGSTSQTPADLSQGRQADSKFWANSTLDSLQGTTLATETDLFAKHAQLPDTSRMAFSMALPWSRTEEEMQRLMNVPPLDNPTSSFLTPQGAFALQKYPLLAVGTLDTDGRPWTTLWGGEAGFSQQIGQSIVGTRTIVDSRNDPVVQILVGAAPNGEVVKEQGKGRMVSGLAIDLMSRKRVKLYGRMIAGALGRDEDEPESPVAQIQLVVKIEQSLGNCPKYLNQKEVEPAMISSRLLSDSPQLPPEAVQLLRDADLFFISSSDNEVDMDTNHRGGPAGFIRLLSNEAEGAEIVYPEYSGNRFYQTVGNLRANPKAGIVIPDFANGNVLYLTGTTEIFVGKDAAEMLPRSNLAVKIKVRSAKLVQQGLPFRGKPHDPSPYNPPVRLLKSEGNVASKLNAAASLDTARLIKKTQLSPSITRYRFSASAPISYEAGQWIAMDYSEDLDLGYSHMRDDDPLSINDDFVRTFTISSPPSSDPANTEFEITAREHGPVTAYLSKANDRAGLSFKVLGVGGDFKIAAATQIGGVVPFVAGGVGITPLLGQLASLPVEQVRLFWTVRAEDLSFVAHVLEQHPDIGRTAQLFVTGPAHQDEEKLIAGITSFQAQVRRRRLEKADLNLEAERWFLCAGTQLQKVLLEFLEGKVTVYESFNY